MRISSKSLALCFASVVLAVGGLATPAAAGGPQAATVAADGAVVAVDGSEVGQVTIHKRGDGTEPPASLGNPSEWGVVEIEMDASAGSVKPMSEVCKNAGGGEWCYGWYWSAGDGKYCYSNYYHNTKTHGSTVEIGGGDDWSGWVRAKRTSNANRTAGLAYTCKTYYSIK